MTINWNGTRRWIALLLLLAGIGVTFFAKPVIPVIQLPGEVYPVGWKLFGFIPLEEIGLRMTNTFMGSIVVWVLLGLLMFYVSRNAPKGSNEVPRGGFYNFFEMLFEGLYDFIAGVAGGPYLDIIFKMFATIFFIVLLSNWQSIIPGVDSIGFIEPHISREDGVTPLDGYDAYRGIIGWGLNANCPWVSPEAAAQLTEAEIQARIANQCVSGISAEAEHTEESASGEGEHEATTEGETNAESVTEAVAEGEATSEATTEATSEATTEAVAEDEHEATTEGSASAEGEHETTTAEGEHETGAAVHHTPGDPHYPWVVLPFVRPPSTDLNMTLALALIAVVMIQVLGFRSQGFGYLTKFFNFKTLFTSPLGGIDVAVGLLELIGEFAKILSFSFRLLGNVFAGSVLLFVMSFLLPFLPWPFFILEFFVGALQAFVFGLLTAIFMNLATVSHGHEEHEEGHEEAAHAH